MPTLNFDRIVKDFRATCALRIAHHGDCFVISIRASVNLKTSSAGAGIRTIPVVVDVVVLDGDPWLDEIREDNATASGVPNFKAVNGDIGIRRLTRSTRAYDAIGPAGTTVDDREISTAVIAEGDWVALRAVDIRDFQFFRPDATSLKEDTVTCPETWFERHDVCNALPRRTRRDAVVAIASGIRHVICCSRAIRVCSTLIDTRAAQSDCRN